MKIFIVGCNAMPGVIHLLSSKEKQDKCIERLRKEHPEWDWEDYGTSDVDSFEYQDF
jgi:hypothetical protein